MKRGLWLCLCCLMTFSNVAFADDGNFRPYVVGARAAGMGGAFTALADDGSGGYYNPGGLAFAQKSSVSFSASVYGIVKGSIQNALGAGQDFSYSDLNIFPVSTSLIQKFGAVDPRTGSPNNALFFSVFVPDAVHTDDRSDLIGVQSNALFSGREEQTVWVGGGYSRRFGSVGVGVGAYALIGTSKNTLDFNIVADKQRFAVVTGRVDAKTLAAVGSIGLRWNLSDSLSLGLAAFSPAFGGGSRSQFTRVAVNPDLASPAEIHVDSRTGLDASPTLPYRLQTGLAWQSGSWTLSADALFIGPREVQDNPELAVIGFDRHIVRRAVLNGSLGAEVLLSSAFSLRLGAFTDFSASPETVVNSSLSNSTHIDHFGGTLSGGYKSDHVRTDLGVIVSAGSGKQLAPQNLDFSQLVPVNSTELFMYIFLATAYEF